MADGIDGAEPRGAGSADPVDPDDELDDRLSDDLSDDLNDELNDERDAGGEAAMIAAARRKHGSFGAVVAAGMLGFDKLLGRKPTEEAPIVMAAPTDPIDIDADGITVPLDAHTDLVAPPLPRTAPKVAPSRRRRR